MSYLGIDLGITNSVAIIGFGDEYAPADNEAFDPSRFSKRVIGG